MHKKNKLSLDCGTMDHALAEAIRRAEEYKKEGNELFKAKDYANSIVMYTNAINLDPENAVYFSNRSAAYLASKDGRGKALKDGIQCIELKPNWVKGYLRKGAAEHALERFKEAMDTYNLGLAIDPENTSLLEAMNMVRVLYEKKQKKEMEMEKRKEEEHLEKLKNKTAAEFEEDDLLADFMNEVEEIEVKVHKNPEKELVDLIDFGSGERQVARLTQDHFQWINLNPFNVMMLEIDATEDTIKQHYKKVREFIVLVVGPFFHKGVPELLIWISANWMVYSYRRWCIRINVVWKTLEKRLKVVFVIYFFVLLYVEVKKAYQLLLDEKKRKLIVQTVLNARARVKKERRMKIKKGVKCILWKSFMIYLFANVGKGKCFGGCKGSVSVGGNEGICGY